MSRIAEQPPTTSRGNRAEAGVDPAPAMRARLAGGIAFTAFSLAVIVGMPIFLTQAVGSRWPDRGPVLRDFETLHLKSDTELLFGGIALAGWGLWLVFTIMVLYAVIGAIADVVRWGIAAETWRDASNPVRWMAGLLIGAVAALWPATANAAPSEPVDQTIATRTLTDDELAATTAPYTVAAAPESETESTAASAETTGEDSVTHTVAQGESLWSIAGTYYGNPLRYMEIFEANQGHTFPDGRTLSDPKRINPGWELTIPTDQPTAQDKPADTAAPPRTVHTVGPGDSLWSLAEQYLGDGQRYMEIFNANQGREFTADGQQLTIPRHIEDGWDLVIPGDPAADDSTEDQPEDEQADSPESESAAPAPEPDAGAELEGEGEITDPDQSAPAAPDETEAPPTADDATTAPADATASDNDTNPASALSAIPVGVWLGTGTFLAASTAALLAARAKRRKTRDQKGSGEDRPVTGRLADLEAMIDLEQHRLTEHVEPEPIADDMVVPDLDVSEVPIGADRVRTIDLADLAIPALGLTGPGHKGAVRAAIITALDTDHPVTATAGAADLLDIAPDTSNGRGPVRIADDLEDACNEAAEQQHDTYRLLICTGDDIDRIGAEALAEHLALHDDRVIVLGECTIGPTATLAADGTLEAATGSMAGIEQCYIAEAALFHEVLADHTEPATAPADTEPSGQPGDEDDAESAPVSDEPVAVAEDIEPAAAADPAAGPGFRLCVFGDLDLYHNGVPVKLKQHARALTLLAALASADEGRTMEELLDIVTPDRKLKGAREYVNIIKSNLRATIRDLAGDDTLDPVPYDAKTERFRLDTDLIATDLADIDATEQQAALTTEPAEQIAALERLVRLHTGDLAPDIEHLADLRQDYRATVQRACTRLAEHYSEHGDPAKAAKYRAMIGRPYGAESVDGKQGGPASPLPLRAPGASGRSRTASGIACFGIQHDQQVPQF